MASIPQLQKQFLDYVASLFNEEVLDEQFIQVQRLKPKDNPNFVVQLLAIFSRDAARQIAIMAEMLEQPTVDFLGLYETAQTLRGSSATIGAAKIKSICSQFEKACNSWNSELLTRYVRQLRYEIAILKSKLECFFNLEKQIQDAGGEVPPIKLKMVNDLKNVKPT